MNAPLYHLIRYHLVMCTIVMVILGPGCDRADQSEQGASAPEPSEPNSRPPDHPSDFQSDVTHHSYGGAKGEVTMRGDTDEIRFVDSPRHQQDIQGNCIGVVGRYPEGCTSVRVNDMYSKPWDSGRWMAIVSGLQVGPNPIKITAFGGDGAVLVQGVLVVDCLNGHSAVHLQTPESTVNIGASCNVRAEASVSDVSEYRWLLSNAPDVNHVSVESTFTLVPSVAGCTHIQCLALAADGVLYASAPSNDATPRSAVFAQPSTGLEWRSVLTGCTCLLEDVDGTPLALTGGQLVRLSDPLMSPAYEHLSAEIALRATALAVDARGRVLVATRDEALALSRSTAAGDVDLAWSDRVTRALRFVIVESVQSIATDDAGDVHLLANDGSVLVSVSNDGQLERTTRLDSPARSIDWAGGTLILTCVDGTMQIREASSHAQRASGVVTHEAVVAAHRRHGSTQSVFVESDGGVSMAWGEGGAVHIGQAMEDVQEVFLTESLRGARIYARTGSGEVLMADVDDLFSANSPGHVWASFLSAIGARDDEAAVALVDESHSTHVAAGLAGSSQGERDAFVEHCRSLHVTGRTHTSVVGVTRPDEMGIGVRVLFSRDDASCRWFIRDIALTRISQVEVKR